MKTNLKRMKGEIKMSINLVKGQRIELTKGTGVKKIKVGLGWDEKQGTGADFDLDASCLMVCDAGKIKQPTDFIFFNNLKHPSGAVTHTGDNLTGKGAGEDEIINVEFDKIPANIVKLIFAINIYDAKTRGQNFGMVNNAFVRIVDLDTNVELCKYDLSENFSSEVCVLIAEIYKNEGEWKFKALGEGHVEDLKGILATYGQ
jgi:tellurium resistance protein TerD